MHKTVLTAFALSASMMACKDHTQGSTHATTQAVAPGQTTPTPAAAGAEHLTFANGASSIGFTGAKVTGSHEGSFQTFTGTLDLARDITQSRLEVTIQTDSITTDNPQLTTHLKSPDFFNVAQFPRAIFRTTTIAAGAAAPATHTITGTLELHGQTRSVTFPASINVSPQEVAATADFTINRRDFGIVYAGMPDNLIRDDVRIRLNLHAARTAVAMR